jgi:hypothetical protein
MKNLIILTYILLITVADLIIKASPHSQRLYIKVQAMASTAGKTLWRV